MHACRSTLEDPTYGAVLRGPRPFTVPILFSVLETSRAGQDWWHECHNIVLGADNRFYSCDKALTFPYEKLEGVSVGGHAQGMDWTRRGGELADARAVVEATVPGKRQYFCPMGVVFFSGYNQTDPKALLENFTRVSGIFGEELQGMVDELKDTPAFRALYSEVNVV